MLPSLGELCRAVAEPGTGRAPTPGKVLIAGSSGLEGEAVVAAVAVRMRLAACSCHQALTYLLHQNAALLVRATHPAQAPVFPCIFPCMPSETL